MEEAFTRRCIHVEGGGSHAVFDGPMLGQSALGNDFGPRISFFGDGFDGRGAGDHSRTQRADPCGGVVPFGGIFPSFDAAAVKRTPHKKRGGDTKDVSRHPKVFAVPISESFRPPFSKGGADPTRGALVAARRRRNSPNGAFLFASFFFCASMVKRKSG